MTTRRSKKPPIPPKALRDLWDQVPDVGCRGLCAEACGPIDCSPIERRLIEARAGKPLDFDATLTCSMLRDGRCTAYTARPLICRIWAATPAMRCPWGCEPDRWLTDAEARALLAAAERLTPGRYPDPR